MSVFEQELNDAFNESEKIESTAKEVENRIKSIDGAAQYMPKRAYGTPVNGAAMSMTLKYLINSKDRQLAAYLNIADGTFRKMEEAEESEIYTNKDLADLLQMAHKMRMDEIKAQAELEKAQATNVKSQTNVQINEGLPFGQGNYGKLMDKLLKDV